MYRQRDGKIDGKIDGGTGGGQTEGKGRIKTDVKIGGRWEKNRKWMEGQKKEGKLERADCKKGKGSPRACPTLP